VLIDPSPLVHAAIGAAIAVHRRLGPGLLESAYATCLHQEFMRRGVAVQREVPIPLRYEDEVVDCAYRADFIVERELLLEIKSVERFDTVHRAQVLTYMKLLDLRQGLLINFNKTRLVDGVQRLLR
jgi:GxxExxY protein